MENDRYKSGYFIELTANTFVKSFLIVLVFSIVLVLVIVLTNDFASQNIVLAYIIFVFCILWLSFFVILLIVMAIRSLIKTNDFITFMKNQKDFNTLYRIGLYNKQGLREGRRVPYSIKPILLKRYEETGIDEYRDYAEKSSKSGWIMVFSFLAVFLGICVITDIVDYL